jgi:peptidoglycan LD-endopeptidase LytH
VRDARLGKTERESRPRDGAGVWSPRALAVFYTALGAFLVGVVVFVSARRRPVGGRIGTESADGALPAAARTAPTTGTAGRRSNLALEPAARTPILGMPIEGLRAGDLRESFTEIHGGHRHEAIDILEPRGTPILAVDDGTIRKLFHSVPGGITIYQFDPSESVCYYYAHLDRYAEGLAEGRRVRRGDRIGYVGTSGNAPPQTPHLHFAIYRLGPEKHWWQGEAIDPYPVLVQSKPAP